jgi:hypothetical protein
MWIGLRRIWMSIIVEAPLFWRALTRMQFPASGLSNIFVGMSMLFVRKEVAGWSPHSTWKSRQILKA